MYRVCHKWLPKKKLVTWKMLFSSKWQSMLNASKLDEDVNMGSSNFDKQKFKNIKNYNTCHAEGMQSWYRKLLFKDIKNL